MGLHEVKELLLWATEKGARLHERVEPYIDPNYGIALRVKLFDADTWGPCLEVAATDVAQLRVGSRVVSCPFNLSLSYVNATGICPDLESHSPRLPDSLFSALEPYVIGHFFLVQQYLLESQSFWSPYIRSLPQPEDRDALGTPPYFTEEDMAWLRGTDLETATGDRLRLWKTNWEAGQKILDNSPGWEHLRGRWTWELYKWAASIFSSRSFTSFLIPHEVLDKDIRLEEAFHVLFPVVDLANHSPTAKVTWFSDVHGEPKTLSIYSEAAVKEGQQIFSNYVPRSNSELLMGYGFCIPGNDVVGLRFKDLGPKLRMVRDGHYAAVPTHAGDALKIIYHACIQGYRNSGGITQLPEFSFFERGCVDTMAVLVANKAELAALQDVPDHCMEFNADIHDPMGRNTLHTISALHEDLTSQLVKIIKSGKNLQTPKNHRQATAKLYRDGQVATLTAVTHSLQARLDAAVSHLGLCNHELRTRSRATVYEHMQNFTELLTLECAYAWLEAVLPSLHEAVIEAIQTVLELESDQPINWAEVIDADWAHALWCFWIYIVFSLSLHGYAESESPLFRLPMIFAGTTLKFIKRPENLSAERATFKGANDELLSLQTMIQRIEGSLEASYSGQPVGQTPLSSELVLGISSEIATQMTLPMFALNNHGLGPERTKQRVLFLMKVDMTARL